MPPPLVSMLAPGSRMKVTPVHGLLQVTVEPPLSVRTPDMKYTDTPEARLKAVLPFVAIVSFVHLLAAV
jgi:hypothetical protein